MASGGCQEENRPLTGTHPSAPHPPAFSGMRSYAGPPSPPAPCHMSPSLLMSSPAGHKWWWLEPRHRGRGAGWRPGPHPTPLPVLGFLRVRPQLHTAVRAGGLGT